MNGREAKGFLGAAVPDGGSRATSRAIVVDAPGTHRLITVPRPQAGPGEVLVEVGAAGVCMSDREVYEGRRAPDYVRYPVTPGHEWSGTVVATGAGVDPAVVGRKTVAEGFRFCGTCERCRNAETSLCAAAYAETGFTHPGAFADHVVVPARLLHLLPDDADLRGAALLEPAAVVAAAVRAGAPEAGERIAVVGAGTLGLLAVQLLAASSPGELTVIDPRLDRAELACRMGATEARTPVHSGEAHGYYDLVVETAGARTTAADACLLARRGGRVVLTGMFAEGALGIDPVHLSVSQLTVRSVFGAPSAAWSFAVRAYSTGLFDPAELITHEFPLERYTDALALVGGGDPKTGKVLLRP